MRYQPVTLKDRSHVGKHWTRHQLRSFQIMLRPSRGVVSGNPDYFVHAYGADTAEFEHILSLPHEAIFHRGARVDAVPEHVAIEDAGLYDDA